MVPILYWTILETASNPRVVRQFDSEEEALDFQEAIGIEGIVIAVADVEID